MPFKSEKQRKWMHANEPEMAKKWEKEESINEADASVIRKKLLKQFGDDPLYREFILAKTPKDQKKALKTLKSIRGFNAVRLMQKYVKKLQGESIKGKLRNLIKQEIKSINEGFDKYYLGGLGWSVLKKKLEIAIKKLKGKVDGVGMDYIHFRMPSSNMDVFTALIAKLDKDKNVWIGDKRKKNIWDRRRNIDKLREESKRDYKAEYKKFQSSPKAKKYRAELNKYNRKKGTYGNGDGKDASHKGGKIVGFESQSKNRGRREKSRLKKEGFGGQLNAKDLKQFEKQRKENAEVLGYTVTGVSDVKETTLEVNPKEKGNKNEDNK